MTKVLVCGGRDFNDADKLNHCLDILHKKHGFTCLVHGDARGADRLAGEWAEQNDVDVITYPALWDQFGTSAGPIRNKIMFTKEAPDIVIAFPGGSGTAHMVNFAKNKGAAVIEVN
jgi:hypothetical protein